MIDYIFWEITHRCNQRCVICPLHGKDKISVCKKELPFNDVVKLLNKLDKAFKYSRPRLKISGGEPFIRKDLIEILHEIEQLGFPYGLMSNFACLPDTDMIDAFLSCSPKFLNVSLDGDEKTHEQMRDSSGSYKETLKALKYYIDNLNKPVSIELNMVIQPDNLEHMAHVVDLARMLCVAVTFQHVSFMTHKEYECQKLYDIHYFGHEINHYINKLNFFSKEDANCLNTHIREIERYAEKQKVPFKVKPNLKDTITLQRYYSEEILPLGTCSELGKMLFIQPDGTVNACFECYPIGRLADTSAQNLLNSSVYHDTLEILSSNVKYNPICKRCCKAILPKKGE